MLRYILGVFACVAAEGALACSCTLGDVSQKLSEAQDVFVGKVTSVIAKGSSNDFGEERVLVSFSVDESWKGNAAGPIVLDTVHNGVSCLGYWFKENLSYLVYTYQVDGKLDTYVCGGVIAKDPIEDFNQEVQALHQATQKPSSTPIRLHCGKDTGS